MLLLDIVIEYKDVIENKTADAMTNTLKHECWGKICHKFNTQQDSGIRNSEQLRNLYDCLKRRVEIYKTGGGSVASTATVGTVSERVIGLISDRITPLTNEFDSDTNYHGKINIALLHAHI
ncbi:hypothetical protein ANN_27793 [Periplaneta americana]|uniref:Regulatory protein zeste n=1 Tax=Periplaneta americana TaxID=6978 RepID=A0ABQ8RVA5_PERAM|nr:hypothetical protein ANN_27793 [Periplaneta americana]